MAKNYPAGYAGYIHSHARAQFLYAASGSMKISFDIGCWIIPPQRAVWVPPRSNRQHRPVGDADSLHSRGQLSGCAPDKPKMIGVSPVLRELVLRSMQMPIEYDEQGQDARILAALMGEIDWTPLHPISLPPLRDARLQEIEAMLTNAPDDRSTLGQWSERLGISPRTLTRLLQQETRLPFQVWRDLIRTFAALPLLAESRPLAEIADALGYDTAWAFTEMFKRVTGKLPSRYFADQADK